MLPIILIDHLPKSYRSKWDKQFVTPGRSFAEGIWRRTQEEQTADKSGWKGPKDCRRRIIHFLDRYDVLDDTHNEVKFAITGVYLWMCVTLPNNEISQFEEEVYKALKDGNWKEESNNKFINKDLSLEILHYIQHPEDVKAGREMPKDYRTIEFTLKSDNMSIIERVIDSPWSILSTGIRQKGTRTNVPQIIDDVSLIEPYFPFQVELAGGASIELGIPPLNHLHTTYNVTNKKDGTFVFGEDPFLPNLLRNPVKFYLLAGSAYKTCLMAEPNEFYLLLRSLYDKGLAVGDVITNNFDGMPSLVNLHEKYVRRFDEAKHYPIIEFDPKAKGLLVIGNHADRRRVQLQARQKGLKIVYVDPEMYFNYYGEKIKYPLENLDKDDFLFQMNAVEFAQILSKYLNKSSI